MSTPTPGRPATLALTADQEDAGALLAVAAACRKALPPGRPRSGPARVLREALWFIWEGPRLPDPLVASKYPKPYPWSPGARAVHAEHSGKRPKGGWGLVIEHLYPRELLVAEFLDGTAVAETAGAIERLRSVLWRLWSPATRTGSFQPVHSQLARGMSTPPIHGCGTAQQDFRSRNSHRLTEATSVRLAFLAHSESARVRAPFCRDVARQRRAYAPQTLRRAAGRFCCSSFASPSLLCPRRAGAGQPHALRTGQARPCATTRSGAGPARRRRDRWIYSVVHTRFVPFGLRRPDR